MNPPLARDAQLVLLETRLRQAIRDSVNCSSRKPFAWGGLRGYQQLAAIHQALQANPGTQTNAYLQLLSQRVARVLTRNRELAKDVQAAHQGLVQIAQCLHYPASATAQPTAAQVKQAIEDWLRQWQPSGSRQQAQKDLHCALRTRWQLYGPDLLPCYDLPSLPQDNLRLEAGFGRLRRHQRRISGKRSTHPLHDFGQVQILFHAESQPELLCQIQRVSPQAYRSHRLRLAQHESQSLFFRRFHHDPLVSIQDLLAHHAALSSSLHNT